MEAGGRRGKGKSASEQHRSETEAGKNQAKEGEDVRKGSRNRDSEKAAHGIMSELRVRPPGKKPCKP